MMIMKKRIVFFLISISFFFHFTSNIYADGFILVPRSHPSTPFPLEVKYHHVDVKIKGVSAVTSIDQEFYNPSGRRLEGYFIFPVPKGAVIDRFSMFINGKETEAELLDAKKARKIYEDIVRKQLDPAILEYDGQDIFKVRIFPIEPRSVKRIKLSYNEILKKDNGTIEYLYPLNTEKFSSKPLKDVAINVDIKSDGNLKNIYSTTHDIDILRKEMDHTLVSYEARNVTPNEDFRLYYNTDKSKVGLSLLAYREAGGDGYFYLCFSPGLNIRESEISEKDITFVLDVSGSMAGDKLKQAKRALNFCIENLNKGDRFQIVRFSTEAEALFDRFRRAEETNFQKARNFINNLRAIGGTNIKEALELALSTPIDISKSHIVIFITDGKPTIGEINEDKMIKMIGNVNTFNTRIFTFGIGYDINTHLLDKITTLTRAHRTYISPNEDIEVKISNFYTKVQSPVLTDLKLRFSGIRISKTYPRDLPDLFRGSSLVILGQYSGEGRAGIVLTGKVRDREQQFQYNVYFSKADSKNAFIPPLWAARRIGYLLDQVRLNGEDAELIGEITNLARKHGIVTPYTSYLILEDEERRVSRRELDDEHQTLGSMNKRADLVKRSKREYKEMMEKSGRGSIQASEEFQALNRAKNFPAIRQGKSRLVFRDNLGGVRNLIQQVRNVHGRAIYYSGNFWVDSRIQESRIGKKVRIQFASKRYFQFLRENPESAQFLALGRNVRFVLYNKVYEIYE
ncbi:MAG: VIT domain-containing protein [Spirochaetota bacterium]|nr:VIT domain-containing protein [Spirochaetota bacterium]